MSASQAVIRGGALHGPLPRLPVGDGRARRGPPAVLERRAPQGPEGPRPRAEGARFALWKNPEDLTERQQAALAEIARTNRKLYRAYLLKEQLRLVFHQQHPHQAIALLDRWLAWASRSQLPAFVKTARSVRKHRTAIYAAIGRKLTNARIEAVNTRIRLLTRVAFGFHSPAPLIALAMLSLGGLCPPLPGR